MSRSRLKKQNGSRYDKKSSINLECQIKPTICENALKMYVGVVILHIIIMPV